MNRLEFVKRKEANDEDALDAKNCLVSFVNEELKNIDEEKNGSLSSKKKEIQINGERIAIHAFRSSEDKEISGYGIDVSVSGPDMFNQSEMYSVQNNRVERASYITKTSEGLSDTEKQIINRVGKEEIDALIGFIRDIKSKI